MKSTSKRLFVGSLPYRYSESELLKLFIPYGKVIDVRIIRNHWGRSRGMGYVEFETVNEAVLAKENLHKHQVKDMAIIVDFAKADPAPLSEDKFKPTEKIQKIKTKPNIPISTKHIRPSVYKSQKFGARIGKKFASRSKKKN
jgi:RNA recognition motif-containing protein